MKFFFLNFVMSRTDVYTLKKTKRQGDQNRTHWSSQKVTYMHFLYTALRHSNDVSTKNYFFVSRMKNKCLFQYSRISMGRIKLEHSSCVRFRHSSYILFFIHKIRGDKGKIKWKLWRRIYRLLSSIMVFLLELKQSIVVKIKYMFIDCKELIPHFSPLFLLK